MTGIWSNFFSANFIYTIIRVSAPLIFASLVVRRGSVINITIDSTVPMAALAGVPVSHYSGSLWFSILCGMLVGIIMGVFMGYFHIIMSTNMILTGVAISTFTNGATVMFLCAFAGDKGSSSNIGSPGIPNWDIPVIKDIPILGEILSGHNAPAYVAFMMVVICWYLMCRTALGLRVRSVGESLTPVKPIALALSGFFASLGGLYMSMGNMAVFITGMTAAAALSALLRT